VIEGLGWMAPLRHRRANPPAELKVLDLQGST
jgi:hypothetical protein